MIPEFLSLDNIEALAREYGYWAVFLGIFLENTGLPLPGESLTLVGGFLAGSGDLRLGGVLASAFGGAVLGDNLGYWLGRWGGWPLLQRLGRVFRFPEAELEKGRERFRENARVAVTLGRFVTFLRIFAGPMAGTVAMPYGEFLLCNAAGAMLWVLTIVGIAYGAGQLVPLAVLVDWLGRFGLFALGAVLIWVGAVVWLRRSKMVPLDQASSEPVTPGTAATNVTVPNATVTSAATSDTATPDTATPDTATSDTTVTSAAISDLSTGQESEGGPGSTSA
ncbi:MAG: DedA family protein [Prochlorothrix sp.]